MTDERRSRFGRSREPVPEPVEEDVTGKIETALEELERGAGSQIEEHKQKLANAIRRTSRPPDSDSTEEVTAADPPTHDDGGKA